MIFLQLLFIDGIGCFYTPFTRKISEFISRRSYTAKLYLVEIALMVLPIYWAVCEVL